MRYKGIVEKGERKGSQLGFPTINISLEGDAAGIYAAKVYIEGSEYPAAAYVNTSRKILEAHLLNFSGDLYGKKVEVELLKKIRDDKTFSTEPALMSAIAEDLKAVRQYLEL